MQEAHTSPTWSGRMQDGHADGMRFPHRWALVVPAGWAVAAVLYVALRALDAPVALGLAYAAALLGTVAPLLLVLRRKGAAARVGLVWSWRPRWLLVTLLGLLLIGQLWVPMQAALARLGVPMLWPARAAALGATSVVGWALLVAVAVVLIPVLEEALYRGFLLAYLTAHGLGGWTGITVTALLFAATHIVLGPGLVLFTVPFGLFVGWLTLRTGSLTYACVFHVLNNAWAHLVVPALFG